MAPQPTPLDFALLVLACASVGWGSLVYVCRLLRAASRCRMKSRPCGAFQAFQPWKHLSWRHLDFLDITQPKDQADELVRNLRLGLMKFFWEYIGIPFLILSISLELFYIVYSGAELSATMDERFHIPGSSVALLFTLVCTVWRREHLWLWQLGELIALFANAMACARADSLQELMVISRDIDTLMIAYAGFFGNARLIAVGSAISCFFQVRKSQQLDPIGGGIHVFTDSYIFIPVIVAIACERLHYKLAAATLDARVSRRNTSIFRRLLSVLCDVVIQLDTDVQLTESSPQLAALLMKDGGSACQKGDSFLSLIAPHDRPAFMQTLGRRPLHDEVSALQLPSVEIVDVTGRRVQVQLFHVPYMDEDDRILHLIGLCEIGAENGESSLFDARPPPSAPNVAATVYGAEGLETENQEDGSVGLQPAMSVDRLPAGIVGTLEVTSEEMMRRQQDWLKQIHGHSQRPMRSKSSGKHSRHRNSSQSSGSSSHSGSSHSSGGTSRSPPASGSIFHLGPAIADLTIARLCESLGVVECIVESLPPFWLIGCSYGFRASLMNASSSMSEVVSKPSLQDFLSTGMNALFTHAVEQFLYDESVDPLQIQITLRPRYLRKCKIEVQTLCSIEMGNRSENKGQLIKLQFTSVELRRQSGSLQKTAMNVSL